MPYLAALLCMTFSIWPGAVVSKKRYVSCKKFHSPSGFLTSAATLIYTFCWSYHFFEVRQARCIFPVKGNCVIRGTCENSCEFAGNGHGSRSRLNDLRGDSERCVCIREL